MPPKILADTSDLQHRVSEFRKELDGTLSVTRVRRCFAVAERNSDVIGETMFAREAQMIVEDLGGRTAS